MANDAIDLPFFVLTREFRSWSVMGARFAFRPHAENAAREVMKGGEVDEALVVKSVNRLTQGSTGAAFFEEKLD